MLYYLYTLKVPKSITFILSAAVGTASQRRGL